MSRKLGIDLRVLFLQLFQLLAFSEASSFRPMMSQRAFVASHRAFFRVVREDVPRVIFGTAFDDRITARTRKGFPKRFRLLLDHRLWTVCV